MNILIYDSSSVHMSWNCHAPISGLWRKYIFGCVAKVGSMILLVRSFILYYDDNIPTFNNKPEKNVGIFYRYDSICAKVQ